jgi:NADP-dependent 3-hydroxy acid dehydrogenase YdfG
MNRRLKHAVIAGYGSGPGAAVAQVFAQESFALALIARDAGKLAHAAPGYAESNRRRRPHRLPTTLRKDPA